MVFSLFGLNELKESVASARIANFTLSVFEHVEVDGFDKDVEDKECGIEGIDDDVEGVVISTLP